MSEEESTTPDLVERWQQAVQAFDRRDFDAFVSFFAPDAIWDASDAGVGTFEGAAAIRSFLEDWIAAYESTSRRWWRATTSATKSCSS